MSIQLHNNCTRTVALIVLTVTCFVHVGYAQTDRSVDQIESLERENERLKQSLIASNLREEQCAKTLAKVKTRMGALGKSLIVEDNNRLISALAEIESLSRQITTLENAGISLTDSYRRFLSTVLVSDPDSRNDLEGAIRELEYAIGLREKPQRLAEVGNLQKSKIISIDQDSGLIVLNVGRDKRAKIGMRFEISRGTLRVAEGILAEVRDSVSGLLVQNLYKTDLPIQLGDTAKVILN